MTRDDVENKTKKVFDDLYSRVAIAYNLIRDDEVTEKEIVECRAILQKLSIDLMGE